MNYNQISTVHPLGNYFAQLTRLYVGFITAKLENLPIQRYFYIITLIYAGNGKSTQQEISSFLEIDKASMVRIMDSLTELGLVTKKMDPKDRRKQLLLLTEKGKELVPVIEEAFLRANQIALDGFSEQESRLLMEFFKRMRANLSTQPADNIFLNFDKTGKR